MQPRFVIATMLLEHLSKTTLNINSNIRVHALVEEAHKIDLCFDLIMKQTAVDT